MPDCFSCEGHVFGVLGYPPPLVLHQSGLLQIIDKPTLRSCALAQEISQHGTTMSHYIQAATLSDFEHKSVVAFRYLSRTIGIFKRKDGSFYAMEADCKHQNANLLTSPPRGDIVSCPRHGWKYNLATGECLTEAWAGLRFYPMKIEGNKILVSPTPIEPVNENDDDWF